MELKQVTAEMFFHKKFSTCFLPAKNHGDVTPGLMDKLSNKTEHATSGSLVWCEPEALCRPQLSV